MLTNLSGFDSLDNLIANLFLFVRINKYDNVPKNIGSSAVWS